MSFRNVETIGDFLIPVYSISRQEAEKLPKVSNLSPVVGTPNRVQSCEVLTGNGHRIHLHTTEWQNKEFFLMEVKHLDSSRFFLCKNIIISKLNERNDELAMTIILPEHRNDRDQRTTYRIPNISGMNQGLESFFESQPEITKMCDMENGCNRYCVCLCENGCKRSYRSLYQLGTFERFEIFLRDTKSTPADWQYKCTNQ